MLKNELGFLCISLLFLFPSFDIIGFSLSNWYGSLSLTPGAALYPTQLSMLRESLGVTDYLSPTADQCDRASAPYSPPTPGLTGWKIGEGSRQ